MRSHEKQVVTIIAAGGTLECRMDIRLLMGCRMEADTRKAQAKKDASI